MYNILLFINNILKKWGYQIRKTNNNLLGYYLQKFSKFDLLPSKNGIYEIPVEKCVSQYYFSHSQNGWHQYSQLIKEYKQNPELNYKDSSLFKFYEKFQPQNLQETLFDDSTLKQTVLSKLPNTAVRVLWSLEGSIEEINKNILKEESQLFGPINDFYGEEQFRRCIRAYQLMKKHGYLPEKFHDGYITGFFIKKKNDYRFCIISGKHRVAAMKLLGHKIALAKCVELLQVIDFDDLKNIPIVKGGLVTKEQAKIILNRYFEENGSGRAKKLGLL